MYNSYDVSERIKTLAKQQHKSIKRLLSDVGLGFNTMANMKNSMPKADNLAKIADYLNCSVDYLLGRTDDPMLHTIEKNKPTMPDNIVQISEPDNTPADERPVVMLKNYSQPASAGTGNFLDNDSPYEFISVLDSPAARAANFVVSVSGDSMEPRYHDGDKLFVKTGKNLDQDEFGVFIVNGEAFVKKFGRGELLSLNPKYKPIKIHDYDEVLFAGKVIAVLDENDII